MDLLADIKNILRISDDIIEFDAEIRDLIDVALIDLGISGVVDEAIVAADPIVRRAVSIYVKSNFGWDNPDAERLQKSYDLLKTHMSLSAEYAYYAVTFEVTDASTANPIRMATVEFDGQVKTTDENGRAIFYRRAANNLEYMVTANDYEPNDDDDNLVDVTASLTIDIDLTTR